MLNCVSKMELQQKQYKIVLKSIIHFWMNELWNVSSTCYEYTKNLKMVLVSKGQKHYTDRLKMILISATWAVLHPGQISLMDFPPARCLCVTYRDNSLSETLPVRKRLSCRSSSDPHSSTWALIATDLTVTETGSASNSIRIKNTSSLIKHYQELP